MNSPYVATEQGYRRKIGPKSKYGLNDDTPAYGDGIGPQGAQSSGNARSSFSGQSRLGTPIAKQESRFSASMRESADQTAANKAYDMQKNPPAKKPAPTTAGFSNGKMTLGTSLSKGRAAARKATQSNGPSYANGKMTLGKKKSPGYTGGKMHF